MSPYKRNFADLADSQLTAGPVLRKRKATDPPTVEQSDGQWRALQNRLRGILKKEKVGRLDGRYSTDWTFSTM